MTRSFNLILFLVLFGWNKTRSQTIDTLIGVGNHDLHFNIIKGTGTPILFESGNGDSGSVWEPILQNVHRSTGATLITYDRAGLGKSGIDTTKISFKQEIKDLNGALKSLGFGEDYFLVAHSFGGMYASEFSQRNKGRIKGAVFIDVATPCQLDAEYTTRVRNSISDENWKMLEQHRTGLYYVLKKFPEIADYMSDRYIPGSIPLTLIVAENYRPSPQIGETEEDITDWKKCLRELGNLPNRRYVPTEGTDHRVWEKDPDTIIDEITKLYDRTN